MDPDAANAQHGAFARSGITRNIRPAPQHQRLIEDTSMQEAPNAQHFDADYILVGGGLQNALILLALAERRPQTRVMLFERDQRLGGNHTWSFQAMDLPPSSQDWASRLAEHHWPGYQLYFDKSSRWVEGQYSSLGSEHLERLVQEAAADNPNIQIHTGAEVSRVEAHGIELADGRRLTAQVVVDARGPEHAPRQRGGGYQKFVGLECQLARPAPMNAPILMDTRCRQHDGFRFQYILPFTAERVLIEDTYFSNSPDIDEQALSEDTLEEAKRFGLEIAQVIRTEVGVLPMPSRSTFAPSDSGPINAGYAGGWFNPGTGYSLAAAARLADYLASVAPETVFSDAGWKRLTRTMRTQSRFLAFLNLMMFGMFHGAWRNKLMERFYLVSDRAIHRFFAMEINPVDMWNIMWVGAPWTPKRRLRHAERPDSQSISV
ncbi:lycopene cyclase [Marichromatium purpuratum 984]|uniref:Lycopene cyclase n=2 Tax=Marichromatium purpuratum TaxID=37487 RepID=W0E5A8_MARPU|nr:lycopene cyclase [Marichromatium purpuratum 984]